MKKLLFLFAVLLTSVGAWAQDYEMPVISPVPTDGAWAVNTTWYTIKTGNNYYFRQDGKNATTGVITLKQVPRTTEDVGLWCVTGNATDGYMLYNKAEGPTSPLGVENLADGSNVTFGGSNNQFEFVQSKKTGDDWWCIKVKGTANLYLNENYSSHNLVTWNSSEAVNGWLNSGDGDNGSALIFEPDYTPVNTGTRTSSDRKIKTISLESLFSSSHVANVTTLSHTGNGLQYIDLTETVTMKALPGERVTAAVSLVKGHWINAYVYIDEDRNGFSAGLDTDGYSPIGDLKSYSFYTSLGDENAGYNSAGVSISGNSRNTLVMPSFTAPSVPGTYRMRFKTDFSDILPNGGGPQFNSAWGTIVDVMLEVEDREVCTLKYSFTYGGAEKYTQVQSVLDGVEYPEITVSHPYGVSCDKPTGTISADDADSEGLITKEIALNVDGLPFQFSDTYDDATWYFMCLHPSAKWYLGYEASQTSIPLADAQKTLPADGQDAYQWAFVGNPFDGYKIMNKLAGENMILSSTTTMSNGDEGGTTHPLMIAESSLPGGNNTLWIPTASTHAAKGFYLAQKDHPTHRMNARSSKLAYWTGGADAGSTFQVSTLANLNDYENVISTLLNNAGQVGYPKLNNTAYSALERVSGLSGRATVVDVETAISAYKTTTDICLPEDGQAYQFAFVANNSARTEYKIHADATTLTAGEDITASTFYCRKFTNSNGVERFAFISEDGNLLKFQGLTTSYTTHSGSDTRLCNDFVVSAMTGVNSNVTSAREDRYGTVYLATDNRENAGSVGCFVYKFTQTAGMDGASAPFHDENHTSAIKVTKVTGYPPSAAVSQVASTIDPLAKGYNRVGEGLGKYTYTYGENTGTVFTDFETLIKNANKVIGPSDYSFAINMPAAGFYRIKSQNSNYNDRRGKYLQNTSVVNAQGNPVGLELSNTADINSIMYIDESKTILSYASGQYLNNYTAQAEIGTEASSWTILENARLIGKYAFLRSGGSDYNGYLSDWSNNAYVTNGQNDGSAAWEIEPVETLPFTFNSKALGFATFCAPVDIQLPSGVVAYIAEIIESSEGDVLKMRKFDENMVPANTPVMLYHNAVEEENVSVSLAIVDGEFSNDDLKKIARKNDFYGTIAAETYPANSTVYSLQKHKTEPKVGFYQKASDTTLGGFKSWIKIAGANPARTFTIIFDGDDATGLKEALGIENENVEIYDLSGRRLDKPTKGVNVVGGKLVIK